MSRINPPSQGGLNDIQHVNISFRSRRKVSTYFYIYCNKKIYCSGLNGCSGSFVPGYFFLESPSHVLFKMVRLVFQLQIFVMPEFFEVAS